MLILLILVVAFGGLLYFMLNVDKEEDYIDLRDFVGTKLQCRKTGRMLEVTDWTTTSLKIFIPKLTEKGINSSNWFSVLNADGTIDKSFTKHFVFDEKIIEENRGRGRLTNYKLRGYHRY